MRLLQVVLQGLRAINDKLLAMGRVVGVFAICMMVAVILVQVFCRYVLGNALPWPDEAARFCMLWMTGLMAPTALRNGSFVAIDTIEVLLPTVAVRLLQIVLLFVSLAVLIVAVQIGWKEVTGLGGRFTTASLYIPDSLSFDSWYRIPRSWMMTSLLVGIVLLILVNVELILSRIVALFSNEVNDNEPPASQAIARGAE
ncbi:C4-dicarboxylate ABC transporter permease [Chromatiales bacterium (ex Bugula neritina AB1)]|nr:C4-dicarboxylate ABC transporter permease [Chromatiales bacterium (ex Bugula neritina AB1)]